MGAPDLLIDLDFTSLAALPAVRPENVIGPDTEIGASRAANGGNFISYARAAAPRPAVSPDAPVMVVEDDEDTRRLLERVLKLQGLPVRTAADSRELLLALRKPPLPRLMLLDVELPRVNGFKILALLRQQPQTADLPVVMVTAHAETKHILQAMSLGADGYLSKPVKVATLRAMVARILARSR
jgi:CheY-like chemotaxis protein